jgi:hypothetical protein
MRKWGEYEEHGPHSNSGVTLSTYKPIYYFTWYVHATYPTLHSCAFGVALHWPMGSALSDLCMCSNALAPGPGILMLDIRHRLVLWGRHGSTKPHWGHALFTVRGARACCAGQSGPKPFGGLLRGKHGGCTLDLLVLARTTLARHSCKVWWCVVLSEGAHVVVGEGAWLSASRLVHAPCRRPPGPLLRCMLLINITDKYCHMTSPWTHTGHFWWIKKKSNSAQF